MKSRLLIFSHTGRLGFCQRQEVPTRRAAGLGTERGWSELYILSRASLFVAPVLYRITTERNSVDAIATWLSKIESAVHLNQQREEDSNRRIQ